MIKNALKYFALVVMLCSPLTSVKAEEGPIKIGGVFSYSGLPNWIERAQNTAQMAIDEVNAQGGIKGRQVELITRDDRANPADAVQAAEELINRENVVALLGTSFTHVALAVSEVSKRNQMPYFTMWCTTNKCTWENYHPYIFAMDEAPYVSAQALADKASQFNAKRWVTIAPNIEYGQSVTNAFVKALKDKNPDVDIVEQQWPAMGKVDGSRLLNVVKKANPDAVFSMLYTKDNTAYIRAANRVGFLDDVIHINPNFGWPEEMEGFGDELPEGWWALGYPGAALETEENKSVRAAYKEKFGKTIGLAGIHSYINTKLLLAALEKAEDLSPDAIVKAAKGLEIDTPLGPVKIREIDNRATFGYWIGQTKLLDDGTPVLVNFERNDVEALMPTDEEIRKKQKGE